MKNPNGYGSITKLSGNRRRPWCVRVTSSWEITDDEKLKQKQTVIGCYATHEEAIMALAQYHKDPYVLPSHITVKEMYERWEKEKFPTLSESTKASYTSAWKAIAPLYDTEFAQLRRSHLQTLIDTCGKNYPTLSNIKILFSALFKYAIQNDVVDKDYSATININQYKPHEKKSIHTAFDVEELAAIWGNVNKDIYLTVVLMMIYSGVRVSELLDLRKDDVHLAARYFDVTKSKTSAGVRKVPIANKTLEFFEYWMTANSSPYLITDYNGQHFDQDRFRLSFFTPALRRAGINDHLPHDTRHTCVSLLTAAEVVPSLIKRIVGHSSGNDVTESVYTHFELRQLIDAINKI